MKKILLAFTIVLLLPSAGRAASIFGNVFDLGGSVDVFDLSPSGNVFDDGTATVPAVLQWYYRSADENN